MYDNKNSIMPKKHTIIINIIIVLLFILVIIRYHTFFREVGIQIKTTDRKELLQITLYSLSYFMLDSYVCYLICRVHNPGFGYKDSLQITYIVAFFRLLTLGSGGMPAKVYCYHKKGLKIGDATGVWLIQYLFYKLAVLLMGMVSLLLFPKMISNLPVKKSVVIMCILVAVLIVALLTVAAINQAIIDVCYKKFRNFKISNDKIQDKIEALFGQIRLLQQETKNIINNRKLFIYIGGINIVMLLAYNMIPSIMIRENSNISTWYGINAMSLTNLLAGAIPMPSGFGSVEVVYYSLFTPFDIKANAAGSLIILRLFTVILPFFIGAVLWPIFNRKVRRK